MVYLVNYKNLIFISLLNDAKREAIFMQTGDEVMMMTLARDFS
jgi:hypothetical protein